MTLQKIDFSARIPVRMETDVFVAGGGPAGVAAAVTAAKQGARVFLAENLHAFGGVGTSAGIPFFCTVTDGINFLPGGFGREVYERLFKYDGAAPGMVKDVFDGGFAYDPEVLKRVYDDLMLEARADFTFGTNLIAVQAADGHVEYAVCAAKSGIFAVKARLFIDATGDGDLATMAGASFEYGDPEGLVQGCTLCSLWSGIDWKTKEPFSELKYARQAREDGVLSGNDSGLGGMGLLNTRGDAGWTNFGHVFDVDARDERTVTRGMIEGRRLAAEYEVFYRKYVPGCENARMIWTAQTLGIRESRRITGDYVLQIDDFPRQAVFADEIGRYSYPVDIHESKPAAGADADSVSQQRYQKYTYKNPGESYGIPYRILCPAGLDNVLLAGRCVSTDRSMHGSMRVQAACFITGQAAGMAAAMAANAHGKTREISVSELQKNLKKIGGFLPNCPQ